MLKIVQLVENCQPCPNRMYSSGGVYLCRKKGGYNDLPDDHRQRMPDWCPLVDYPTAATRGVQACPLCGGFAHIGQHGEGHCITAGVALPASITVAALAKAADRKALPIMRALNVFGGDVTLNQPLDLALIGAALCNAGCRLDAADGVTLPRDVRPDEGWKWLRNRATGQLSVAWFFRTGLHNTLHFASFDPSKPMHAAEWREFPQNRENDVVGSITPPGVKGLPFHCDKVPHGGESCPKQCALCAEADGVTVARADGVVTAIASQPIADAARVLAEFAKTAPGRLPQRVQDAIAAVHALGVQASALTQQLARAVEASEEGHDPLCMSILRGKACSCGFEQRTAGVKGLGHGR